LAKLHINVHINAGFGMVNEFHIEAVMRHVGKIWKNNKNLLTKHIKNELNTALERMKEYLRREKDELE
jgi:hypothetical protein